MGLLWDCDGADQDKHFVGLLWDCVRLCGIRIIVWVYYGDG